MSSIPVEPIEAYGLSKKNRPKALFAKIGIVGCGNKGQSIALMASRNGVEVVFIELTEEKVEKAMHEMDETLSQQIDHWGMTQSEKRSILSRIRGSIDYADLAGADMVIDAILSKRREYAVEIRKSVFKRIEEHVEPHAIIATNSTTTVITELSSELEHKDRCVSLHFSTTDAESDVVEVARGLNTSDEAYARVLKFAKLVKRVAIPVEESPGLVSVRMIVVLINEACDTLMEGVATMEDIDLTLRQGLSQSLGPFELADKLGIDRITQWMENLYNEFGDIKYKANPIIKKLVRSGANGRKSGKGFYHYDASGKRLQPNLKQFGKRWN